jgi:hypothetical protein
VVGGTVVVATVVGGAAVVVGAGVLGACRGAAACWAGAAAGTSAAASPGAATAPGDTCDLSTPWNAAHPLARRAALLSSTVPASLVFITVTVVARRPEFPSPQRDAPTQ